MMRRNRGRRERVARKRKRRAGVAVFRAGAVAVTLKLGRKHMRRHFRRTISVVADAETPDNVPRSTAGHTSRFDPGPS